MTIITIDESGRIEIPAAIRGQLGLHPLENLELEVGEERIIDTSTLVAAILTGHPLYWACLPYFQQAQSGQIQGFVAAHTLAELYAVLTRMPKANISPSLAQQLIADNLQALETVPLVVDDYKAAIDLMVANNLPGGGIYNALIAQIAARIEAELLLTLNPRHFTRLGELITAKVQVPMIKGN